jgi:hypothetical protein
MEINLKTTQPHQNPALGTAASTPQGSKKKDY